MISLLILIMMIFTISLLIMMISTIISMKMFFYQEKLSPFECGFDPMNSSRLPFSIQFFLITIIFLIFDVEISILLPLILIFSNSNLTSWFLTSFIFLMILILGLFHEWNQNSLNWTK